MLHLLDDAVNGYLRNGVPLDSTVDISFATPNKEWKQGITRPTVNAYLWEIKRDPRRSASGIEIVEEESVPKRRLLLPRVRVSYFVSVWTEDLRDQHLLLGKILESLLRRRVLPPEFIPEGLNTDGKSIEMIIGATEELFGKEVWATLEGGYRPGIDVQFILPVNVGLGQLPGKPNESIDLRTADQDRPSRNSQRVKSHVDESEKGSP
jgi:hypothetical protein